MPQLTIHNGKNTIDFNESTLVTLEYSLNGIAVSFTARFLYDLLFKRDQEAFNRLTKTSSVDFVPEGK